MAARGAVDLTTKMQAASELYRASNNNNNDNIICVEWSFNLSD